MLRRTSANATLLFRRRLESANSFMSRFTQPVCYQVSQRWLAAGGSFVTRDTAAALAALKESKEGLIAQFQAARSSDESDEKLKIAQKTSKPVPVPAVKFWPWRDEASSERRASTKIAKTGSILMQYNNMRNTLPKDRDFVLFMRVGGFYEIYDHDAELVSDRVEPRLQVAKSKRPELSGWQRMAGFPIESLDIWIPRLCRAGFTVAIADQFDRTSSSTPDKKVSKDRAIVRIVTPGTLVSEEELDSGLPNYLAAIYMNDECASLAYADLSTGQFEVLTVPNAEALERELARLEPAEVLMTKGNLDMIHSGRSMMMKHLSLRLKNKLFVSMVHDEVFLAESAPAAATSAPLPPIQRESLSDMELFAMTAIRNYSAAVLQHSVPSLHRPVTLDPSKFVQIGPETLSALELVHPISPQYRSRTGSRNGTLLHCLDKTSTAVGRRLLLKRITTPSRDLTEINTRLDRVGLFLKLCQPPATAYRTEVLKLLKSCDDLERAQTQINTCISVQNMEKAIKPLQAIGFTVLSAWKLFMVVTSFASDSQFGILNLKPLEACIAEISEELRDCVLSLALVVKQYGEQMKDPSDVPYVDVRDAIADTEDNAEDLAMEHQQEYLGIERKIFDLEAEYRTRLGTELQLDLAKKFGYLTIERVEERKTNKSMYLIAVPKRYSKSAEVALQSTPGFRAVDVDAIGKSKMKVRYTTEKLSALSDQCIASFESFEKYKYGSLFALCEQVKSWRQQFDMIAQALAELDLSMSLALVADKERFVRPVVEDSEVFSVVQGRHPVVQLHQDNLTFTPNSCHLNDKRLTIVTGANMGGKSTFLRQNALMVVMAQMGSFVAAASAHIGIVDRLYARVGASDNIAGNESTFMLEMSEVAAILKTATPRSLVIVDELGRGTGYSEGHVIARAVIEYLHALKCRSLVATHDIKLAHICKRELSATSFRQVDCIVDQPKRLLLFTRKMREGIATKSFGIEVAMLAGVLQSVTDRATTLLHATSTTEEEKLPMHPPEESVHQAQLDAARRKRAAGFEQLVRSLCELNVDQMTPRSALDAIYDLQESASRVIGGEGGSDL